MLAVLTLAAHNSSRWSMATSWPIAVLGTSVTIGGWWVTHSMRSPRNSESAVAGPSAHVRQNARDAKVRAGRGGIAIANSNDSEITMNGADRRQA
jgi:hypothetical protein